MVYQFEGLMLSYAQVASNLCIDEAMVRRTVKLFRETGNVSKKAYDKSDLPRKLTEVVQFFYTTASNTAAGYTTPRD